MKRLPILAIAVAWTLATVDACHAGYVVSLTSPDDLGSISVGQSVTIDLLLSGVAANGPLDSLGATVEIQPAGSGSLFDVPVITAGSVIPSLDGFLTAPASGTADATFDDLFTSSGTPISADGTFYSFSVEALAAGSGTFALTFTSGFAGFDPVPVDNGTPAGLAFTISPTQPIATPEPYSITLVAAFAASAAIGCTRRGRTGCRPRV
jgi:hypothetical protein